MGFVHLESLRIFCSMRRGFTRPLGKPLVDCLTLPFRLARRGWGILSLQTRSVFSKIVASKIPFKYPVYHFGFIWIYLQFLIWADCVSIAFAPCHFGTVVLKILPQAGLNCIAFLYCIHFSLLPQARTPQ